MKKSGVRTFLPLTTRNSGILRRGVFQGYCGLKFERRLKVVLLAGTMGVLGSLAAYAGSSGLPLGANIGNTAPAGSVAAQTVDECLERDIKPWDIACLLLRPVGTIPDFPLSGPGDRESNADPNPGPNPGPNPDPNPDGDGDGDGNNGVGNGHTGTVTGQAGIAEGDPSNPGEGRGFGRNFGDNAGGGNPPDHE